MLTTVFSRLNIGRRLLLSHGLLLAFMVLVAAWCMAEFEAMSRRMSHIVEVSDAKILRAQEMLDAINDMSLRARSVALFSVASLTDAETTNAEVLAMQAAQGRYAAAIAAFEAMGVEDGAEEELWRNMAEGARKTQPLLGRAVEQAREGGVVDATKTLALRASPVEQAWRKNVQALIAQKTALNADAVTQARAAKRRAIMVVSALVASSLLLGAALATGIARSVKRPIDRAIEMAERIAAGDLGTVIDVQGHDEVGRLLQAVMAMQRHLSALVSEIRRCADSIQTASTEVASGNQDLSLRTENAASNLQETSNSLVELTAEMQQSADYAREASVLAADAARKAEEGGRLVSLVGTAMQEIRASSARVAEITSVIDAIAFQTKLLALNAAVEAARAGEYGRGFQVVASEVGGLATRSASAAKEIGALIGASARQVSDGASRAASAGSAMGDVVNNAQRVALTIGEIRNAVASQSAGLGHINSAAGELDHMTQQNAALVEQSAAAAQSLRDQAFRLTALVSTFRLAT